jgi:hypothetical protein
MLSGSSFGLGLGVLPGGRIATVYEVLGCVLL